jgi:hypothetical protein
LKEITTVNQKKQKIETPLADAFVADMRAAFPDQPIKIKFISPARGDDGWFDDYEVSFPQDTDTGYMSGWTAEHMLKEDPNITYFNLTEKTKSKAKIVRDVEAKHDIKDIYNELGEILYQRYPGWEINDGGSGSFIYTPDGRRIHEHSENIMSTNDMEDTF